MFVDCKTTTFFRMEEIPEVPRENPLQHDEKA
jgi:hypothetical protein